MAGTSPAKTNHVLPVIDADLGAVSVHSAKGVQRRLPKRRALSEEEEGSQEERR